MEIYMVGNYLLTHRILSLQLNRQYISGRHVSLSLLFMYDMLSGICICAMSCQQHHHSVFKLFKINGQCHGSTNSIQFFFFSFATGYKCYVLVSSLEHAGLLGCYSCCYSICCLIDSSLIIQQPFPVLTTV